MEEKEELRRKFIKHITYNIIGFMIIFVIFGIIVFLLVKGVTYGNVRAYLYETRDIIKTFSLEELQELISSERNVKQEFDVDENGMIPRDGKDSGLNPRDFVQGNKPQDKEFRRKISPNINIILRDKNGEISNDDGIGRLRDYADGIQFNERNIDKITEISFEDFSYRSITFVYDENEDSENRYIQLLVNVDSEKRLVDSYFKIIVTSVIIGCILSIAASYILSKKTLNPLRDNMIKQMEFVQNVSHELRTPLTIIQAKQELLLQDPEAKIIDKSKDIVDSLNETKRLTRLVKDLLLLSRADANTIAIQKENVNIDEFIQEIVSPYKEIAETQKKEFLIDTKCDTDIEIDSGKIYQLMIIFLDNCLKYTEKGDKIEVVSYMKDNKWIIEIKDTGIGVSDEGLTRIFERFYREDKARTRGTGGVGLGLSIASTIVGMHGGTIKASHNTPKGTIFTIKLPKK